MPDTTRLKGGQWLQDWQPSILERGWADAPGNLKTLIGYALDEIRKQKRQEEKER